MGMKQMLLSVPKVRGFKSYRTKNNVVSLESLNKYFKDGQTVTPAALVKVGLANQIKYKGGIKILSKGKLEVKNLTFSGVKVSQTAKEAIEATGGKLA